MPFLDFSDPDLVASSQKYWFHGITLASIGYGVNLTLFILCLNLLRRRVFLRRGNVAIADRTRHRWDIFSLCYTVLIFGFATVNIILEIIVEERAFVQFCTAPAGPSSYLFDNVFGHITILLPAYVVFYSCHIFAAGLLVSTAYCSTRQPTNEYSDMALSRPVPSFNGHFLVVQPHSCVGGGHDIAVLFVCCIYMWVGCLSQHPLSTSRLTYCS